MPGPAIVYRSDDITKWGPGIGRRLTAPEIDGNFFALAQAIVDLTQNPTSANGIALIEIIGTAMRITLTSGEVLPDLPLPVLIFKFRREWLPFTNYFALDIFTVNGNGIYFALKDHTSGATFNEALEVDSEPALQKIWDLTSNGSDVIYDLGFYFAGRLTDATTTYLYQEDLLRRVLIPRAGDQHNVYLQEPASINPQVMPILHNDANIGSITFEVGQNDGTIVFTDDADMLRRSRLAVGKPALADATAAGLSVGIAAQRVL